MVGHTGRTATTRRIRRLKTPLAIEVEAGEDGRPLRVRLKGTWRNVTVQRRLWRIHQHWWRGVPVRRDYYGVAPEDGPLFTLYQDRTSGEWFRQEYR